MAKMEHFPLVNRLHTDVLEEKYGPIHAHVLRHDDRIREAHLEDQGGISRTYALTFFPERMHPELRPIDQKIRKGEAIGKAFRKEGYAVRKNVVAVFGLKLPGWLKKAFRVKTPYAKARLSEFYAKHHAGKPRLYGKVLEVYTPDFRPPRLNAVDYAQVNAPTETLRKQGFDEDDIWRRLGDDNYWGDVRNRHHAAKRAARPAVAALRRQVEEYLNRPR